MGQTIGSAFAETFGTGQRLGDSFSTRRFAGKAQEIRSKYEQLASTEQKPLQDYLPQMEAELREAAGSSARRGLSLEAPELERLRADIGTAGERAAGAKALAGDQQGARMGRAGTQYALGNFDAGQGQQIAGDTIGATRGAMKLNPATGQTEYNPAAGAQALAGVGANYGNAEAAQGQQQNAASFRLQGAAGIAGQLFNLFQSPEVADPDQAVGLYEGLKQYVPELGKTELRVGDDGVWNIYANGSDKATGSFDPKNKDDMDEFSSMMTSFSRAPAEALNQYTQTRIANIADKRKQDNEFSGKIDDALIKVVTEAKAQGIDADVAKKFFNVGTGSGESKGWQLQELGDQPGSYLMQKNGNVYRIETNVAPDLANGQPGGKVQVFTVDGKPVPPEALNAAERDGLDYSVKALTDVAAINNATQLEWMKGQLGALNAMRNDRFGLQSSSGGNSRGERNNNPGNIEDRGQFKGNPDYLGSDGRFARFRTPEAGQAAMADQLARYMDGKTTGQPLTTVAAIVPTWSPQADSTNEAGSTANYVNYVAKALGVDPNAPLSKADIPRLQAAMAEFESGNTGGSKPSGPMTASAPTPGNVVAGGSDVKPTTAQSAPAAQTSLPASRMSISPEGVRKTASSLRSARDAVDLAQQKLAAFDREVTGKAPKMQRTVPGRLEGFRTEEAPSLTNVQQRVRQRLVSELEAAEQQRNSLTGEATRSTGALERQTTKTREEAEAEEMYSKLGGVRDFFQRVKQ